ncbi:MAG: LysE family translocator [Pseudomonadota bacterium]
MNLDLVTALALFALVSSITPGPNNLMLMSSGANFGFRRTLPHVVGVEIGFVIMLLVVGLGLSELLRAYPVSYQILRVLSLVYLCYLAFAILRSTASDVETGKATIDCDVEDEPTEAGACLKPLTFLQAALFQWVNPKSWAMALTAVSVYAPEPSLFMVSVIALTFALIGFPSVSIWAILGCRLQRLLHSENHRRNFNIGMTLLLVASMAPMLLTGYS